MAKGWINGDETAKQMLARVLKERPLFLFPHPLHRIPFGINNIVEIIGPSPSAKTEILLQVAVTCILPKNWNGIQYGGFGHSVLFLDLDCRLDIFRLSQSLKQRIAETNHNSTHPFDMDLFTDCMKRFSYTRCYDSFQFLSALKGLHTKLEKEGNEHRNGVHVLMIDGIGAFYWIDRGFSSLPQTNPNRKNICLQTVFETAVQELKKLLMIHSVLVLATRTVTTQVKGWSKTEYREYMPLIWQSFVTHRILVRPLDDKRKVHDRVCYLAEWLLPALNLSDEFFVGNAGISNLM